MKNEEYLGLRIENMNLLILVYSFRYLKFFQNILLEADMNEENAMYKYRKQEILAKNVKTI